MRDPMDDIARQARQGSVAAIIQTLNERLSDAGVRTRAVFEDGILQLLCEAASNEQLDRSVLVAQIRQILEELAPRNIRRVKINSRIVREQQLLWLDEISRDPENQLLWSEQIVLAKPNLFKRLAYSLKHRPTVPKRKPEFPKVSSLSSRNIREKSRYQRGIASGLGLSLLLMLVGWLLYSWLGSKLNVRISTKASNSAIEPSPKSALTSKPGSSTAADPFVKAVRLAEQASVDGQTVKTTAQWLDVAAKWERASDLMGAVKPDDNRYKTARARMILYRKNSETAQRQARQKRS